MASVSSTPRRRGFLVFSILASLVAVSIVRIYYEGYIGNSFVVSMEERSSNALVPITHRTTMEERRTENGAHHFSNYYKSLYKYQSPRSRTQNEAQAAVQECGSAPEFADFFRQGFKRRSANGEDMTLYKKFFRDIAINGTFVELGGFNGMAESNTRFFETCLGWEGLLIEANPSVYAQLVKNRPHAHLVSFAASCSMEEAARNKTVSFHDYPFTNAAQATVDNTYAGRRTVEVFCGSLTPVLQDLFQGRVTLLSLDVEGAEPMVVSNIDFNQVFVEILIAESSNAHCGKNCVSRDQTRAVMKKAGYHLFSSVVIKSDLYIHPQSEFLKKMNGIVSE